MLSTNDSDTVQKKSTGSPTLLGKVSVLVAKCSSLFSTRDTRFHENWYSERQQKKLIATYDRVRNIEGAIIEIGCWEGRSTIALARACEPEQLVAIDTWEGNKDEAPDHATVRLAKKRDVFATFLKNIEELTSGNVKPVKQDCHEFLAHFKEPIKFLHLDASHDYDSVKRTLDAAKPLVVRGGVICGDDYRNANERRADLNGGVQRAVKESFGKNFSAQGNFWHWMNQ